MLTEALFKFYELCKEGVHHTSGMFKTFFSKYTKNHMYIQMSQAQASHLSVICFKKKFGTHT